MSRRRVQEVLPISATASSRQVETNQTSSILSDPDGRWVARRQGVINEAFEKRMRLESELSDGAKVPSHESSSDLGSCEIQKHPGESDRIGRQEWDENTPFGQHVGFF